MNDTETPTTGQASRTREIAAVQRHEEAETALRLAQNQVRTCANEVRNLRAQSGQTAELGHRNTEALQSVAERRFRAALDNYRGEVKLAVREDAPDPPSTDLIAAFVLARFGDGFYAALHEAIDAAVDDPSTAVFEVATEAEIDEAVTQKRREQKAAEDQVAVCEADLQSAVGELRESREGR